MKNLIIVLLCIGSLVTQAQTAKIYFIHSTGLNGLGGFQAFIDEKHVCNLKGKRFSIHEVQPGKHKISVQYTGKEFNPKTEPILIEVQSGKSYYIEMSEKTKAFKSSKLDCMELTEISGMRMMIDLKQEQCDK